jgi:hypothetical protein
MHSERNSEAVKLEIYDAVDVRDVANRQGVSESVVLATIAKVGRVRRAVVSELRSQRIKERNETRRATAKV